jgi:hypothetical protein
MTMKDFEQDEQGRRYQDVLSRSADRAALEAALEIISGADGVRRMREAETVHDRPALSGVVRAIEAHPTFARAFEKRPREYTDRLKQAVGVAVRIVMERSGWRKTGRKGLLSKLARWFKSAERYVPVSG